MGLDGRGRFRRRDGTVGADFVYGTEWSGTISSAGRDGKR